MENWQCNKNDVYSIVHYIFTDLMYLKVSGLNRWVLLGPILPMFMSFYDELINRTVETWIQWACNRVVLEFKIDPKTVSLVRLYRCHRGTVKQQLVTSKPKRWDCTVQLLPEDLNISIQISSWKPFCYRWYCHFYSRQRFIQCSEFKCVHNNFLFIEELWKFNLVLYYSSVNIISSLNDIY